MVKGVRFRGHEVVGDIIDFATHYCATGADELVFYDIAASPEGRSVDRKWVTGVAEVLNVPFCVAGGICSVEDAEDVLHRGADKISINTPALGNPELISELAKRFGSQCVVVGIDSRLSNGTWEVYSHTGNESTAKNTAINTLDWISEVVGRGAGEVVLNCMDRDGVRQGFDIQQITAARQRCDVPLVASGGAGSAEHFKRVFDRANVSAALAASVFHKGEITIPELKAYLIDERIEVRL